MKINLNFQLKDLDNFPIQGDGANASKILANSIASMSSNGNTIKLSNWMQKLWKKEVLEIDDTDYEMLVDLVDKRMESLSILAKSQILDYLKSLKENGSD